MRQVCYLFLLIYSSINVNAQNAAIKGNITDEMGPLAWVSIGLFPQAIGTITDSNGYFFFNDIPPGDYTIKVNALGYQAHEEKISLKSNEVKTLNILLKEEAGILDEVVVTGTLKEVNRMESAVPVEVFTPVFFRKNPSPNLFEGLQNINGVRPQINCNVCNTGDIHINGLEGPYTMVLIDGMPIVSSLATVYGLSGIPNSLVERLEVVKGPASSLYGSEAVGGLINVITKNAANAPLFSLDLMGTSWSEWNADIGFRVPIGKKLDILSGINGFWYNLPKDLNGDNFTDVTLQKRISVFEKISLKRKDNRLFQLAGRYFYEDRWGGEMNWNKSFRGGDSIYGESIYTRRWELLGAYQLPVKEKILLSFSFNDHHQNSVYGTTTFLAKQQIAFVQTTWDKKVKRHDLLLGTAIRYTFYDDNTTATAIDSINHPDKIWLPGIFFQDEISVAPKQKILLGIRYDYHSNHGNIFTPRIAWKWSIREKDILRLNAGTGFRVVNLFTEDHAALTGARNVIIRDELKPERSWNINLNYLRKFYGGKGHTYSLETAVWMTYFNNRILPDYLSDPTAIIYSNLNGHALSYGWSGNMDVSLAFGLKLAAGISVLNVQTVEKVNGEKIRSRQLLTERFTGTWSISYQIPKVNISIDYTGNVYGKMLLPVLGPTDPRPSNSPFWSIQNIQFTWKSSKDIEIYAGVKNLLNWTVAKNTPFLIARANDPFDKNVSFDESGQPIATPDNPYALTFDPTYSFGPNQGIRGFLGLRWNVRKKK